MTTALHSIQKTLTEKPWTWRDVSSGYIHGGLSSWGIIPMDTISTETFINECFLAYHFFMLATELPFFQIHSVGLGLGLSVLEGVNAAILYDKEGDYEIDPTLIWEKGLNRVEVKIWKYTPKLLTIVNLVLIVITAPEKPVRAGIYGLTCIITLLSAYKKLPQRVSQIWSYASWVHTALLLYKGDNLTRMCVLSTRIGVITSQFLYRRRSGLQTTSEES